MRRRLLPILGVLAAAGILAISSPANAATGSLYINGQEHLNPADGSCITENTGSVAAIDNQTDRDAAVLLSGACVGIPEADVPAGTQATVEPPFGRVAVKVG